MKKISKNIILITCIFLTYSDYSYSIVPVSKKNPINQSSVTTNLNDNADVKVDLRPSEKTSNNSENKNKEENSYPKYYTLISLVLALLAFILAIFNLYQNMKIKERLTSKSNKSSLEKINLDLKNLKDKISDDNKNVIANFVDFNKNFNSIDSRITKIEEKQKSLQINNTSLNIPIKKSSDFVYQEPIKIRSYEDELIIDFNEISFADFRDRYEAKRIDIKNSEELISSPNAEPVFIDREQGKYYITKLENSNNSFYLFPSKTSDIKIDEISRKIFKFTRGYSEGSYSNWKLVEPSVVQFNNDTYTVNQAGKIEIQG